ncbi:hypothetical protein B0H14DRAFT_2598440 [Mycena olivaceomarginata]|nr:hypothetical protein B0H14DRAFT_2598440 [Mycena olivaceomarginata]
MWDMRLVLDARGAGRILALLERNSIARGAGRILALLEKNSIAAFITIPNSNVLKDGQDPTRSECLRCGLDFGAVGKELGWRYAFIIIPNSNVSKDGQDPTRSECSRTGKMRPVVDARGGGRIFVTVEVGLGRNLVSLFIRATTTMARRVDQRKKESAPEVQPDVQSSEITATQKKRHAAAIHYRKNADIIREKRRIQMAEKRAAVKAKRRKSDKPRVKPAKKSSTPPTLTEELGPSDSEQVTKETTVSTTDTDGKQDTSSNALAEAEREASETLASMWQTGGSVVRPEREAPSHQSPRQVFWSPEIRDLFADMEFGYEILPGDLKSYDEGASGEDEYEVGARTISEVAGHQVEADCPISSPYRISATRHLPPPVSRLSTRVPLQFATPSPSESGESTSSPELLPPMRSVLDYLDDYMWRGRR